MLQKSELRKDYIQNKYVVIAPKRFKRPNVYKTKKLEIKKNKKEQNCPFCPINVDKVKDLLTIGSKNNWYVKVIKNIFPAVTLDNNKAYGQQEVIIDTPDHSLEIENLSIKHIVKIFDAYSERTKVISKNKKISYIIIFKNNGGVAGASLEHSHSQIFATNFIPPHLADKSQKQQEYKLKYGTCVYCDVIKKESKGPRVIYQDKNIIAFCPYAPMYNYEAWIMPKRHLDNITLLSQSEKESFAKALKLILSKINLLNLPYNFYFHQVIHDEDQHLYMKIVPRGSVWAGLEIGSGVVINPVDPDEAAKFYRS